MKSKKKMKNKRYFVLGISILVAILLAITVRDVKQNRNLNFLEEAIKDSTCFVGRIVYSPIKLVKGKIAKEKEKNEIYKKYKELEEKSEKINTYLATIRELEDELNSLKEQLKLDSTLSDYTYIHSNVINRNVGYWYNVITIDKGKKHGIEKGMAVVVNQGLVGKVTKVSNFTSTVKLLTTDEINNKISVKVNLKEKSVYGLLVNYDKKCKCYLIEGISESDEIKKGSQVVSTGLSESFPAGILIGEVKKVVMDKYDLTKVVQVKPSVDFNNITVVSVLKRKAIK